MLKTAAVALSAALGVAAVAHVSSAQADPYVRIGIRVPGLLVVGPLAREPVYYRPYPYGYAVPYWRRDFYRGDFDGRHRYWDRRDYDRRSDRGRGERGER